MGPLLFGALGVEGPERDGVSGPGDLCIAVHQVGEECALQLALVTPEQDDPDREGLHVPRGWGDR